jgi:hypothetical protein
MTTKKTSFVSSLVSIKDHTFKWGESYFGIPAALLSILLALHYYRYLNNGRPSTDQPDAIVGYAMNALGIMVVAGLSGFIKAKLFDPIKNELLETCATAFLLLLFSYLMFH